MNVYSLLERVRKHKPLIHHITNWVTIYDCAQIVKTFGASPVMAHADKEVKDMSSMASALVLNIGTLTEDVVTSMLLAGEAANKKGIPVILDVCGAGATSYRDETCFKLLADIHVSIIKGNVSEIARIAGEPIRTKGVDAVDVAADPDTLARDLAVKRSSIVVITGKEDVVANEDNGIYKIRNGHELMAHVVGTGCMAASVIGTFCAVEKDYALAAAAGLCCYEIAAELAADQSSAPGIFKEKLFDHVYSLNKEQIELMQRIVA